MSENPNLNNSLGEEAEVKAEIEVEAKTKMDDGPQSTIFQKHVYEDKKPTGNGNKKRVITCIVAVVLCAAIAGSAFLINKLIPNDEPTPSINSSAVDLSIKLLEYNKIVKPSFVEIDGKQVEIDNNIKSVSIYNYYENYSFSPYYELNKEEDKKTSSSSTSSQSKKYLYDTKWQVNGIDRKLTKSGVIENHIVDCLNVTAFREMENTFDTLEEYYKYYGIDESTRGFTVEFTDGTEDLVIIVGSQLPSKDANYVTVSGDEKVYAVKSDFIKNYDYLPVDFANMQIIDKIKQDDKNKPYFNENGDLARFDYITISGKIFGDDKIRFEMSDSASADFMPYMMISPYRRPAGEEYVGSLLALADDGLEASSLYTYKGTEENIKACALDDPACVIEFKAGDYHFKISIGGMIQEGSTALSVMADDRPQIFSIDASHFDFITTEYEKMFNQNFIMENIYTLEAIEFEDSEGKYKYSLTHTPVAGAEDAYDTTVKKGNVEVDSQSFKYLYQRVLMLSLLDFTTEEEPAKPILKVTFKHIGDYKDKVLEITKSPHDDYHCIVWVDGTPLGEVLKTSVDDCLDNLKLFNDGKKVPPIN